MQSVKYHKSPPRKTLCKRKKINYNSSDEYTHKLKGTGLLGRFSTIFTRATTSVLPVYFLVHQNPSEKGPTLKGKNMLPLGANSFLLE